MFMYEIGMDIICTDGKAGKVVKVVIDPHTKLITDLIVEKGFLQKLDRVIPVEQVIDVRVEGVFLAISSRELENYPEYRDEAFAAFDPALLDEMDYYPGEVDMWTLRYGQALAGHASVRPVITQRFHRGVDPDRAVVGRGTRVSNRIETIGYIDHLLVDKESEEITHLVIRQGLLPFRAIIPISLVKEVGDQTVYVPLSRKQLKKLEKFTPRADRDILSEIEDKLQADEKYDLGQIKVSLADGLVSLTGPVTSVLGKERAQRIAEGVKGVLGIENQVRTDKEVSSRVTMVLLTDPQTLLSKIDVGCQRGIVTLSGKVDSEETMAAAVEIASRQPGVLHVDNQLFL